MKKYINIGVHLTNSSEYNFLKSDLRASGWKRQVGTLDITNLSFEQATFSLFLEFRKELTDQDCTSSEIESLVSPVFLMDFTNHTYKIIPFAMAIPELLEQGEYEFQVHEVILDFDSYISITNTKVIMQNVPFPEAGAILLN